MIWTTKDSCKPTAHIEWDCDAEAWALIGKPVGPAPQPRPPAPSRDAAPYCEDCVSLTEYIDILEGKNRALVRAIEAAYAV
jgi:hypothetical protein